MAKKISLVDKPRKRSSSLVQKPIKSYFSTAHPVLRRPTSASNHKPNRREETCTLELADPATATVRVTEEQPLDQDVFGAGLASGSRALALAPTAGGLDIDRGKLRPSRAQRDTDYRFCSLNNPFVHVS